MKYAIRQALERPGQLVALMLLAFSARAMAQFEIAPDHFDSQTPIVKKQAVKPATAKLKAQVEASPAGAVETKAHGSGHSAVVAHNRQPNTTTAIAGSESSAASPKPTTKKGAARRKKTAAENVALASTH